MITLLLDKLIAKKASALYFSAGITPMLNLHGKIQPVEFRSLTSEDIKTWAGEFMNDYQASIFKKNNHVDFTYQDSKKRRFRLAVFRHNSGDICIILKPIPDKIPTIKELNLPDAVIKLAQKRSGLIVVAGPAGSGKSTTLAAMLNLINESRRSHIVTIEDPIEYLYPHQRSIVSQREVGLDCYSYAQALKETTRQDPDVILIGDMRDQETISTAVTAAEIGYLVLAGLHSIDTVQALDRIIDVFPPEQQPQIRTQLALSVQGIICQQLLMRQDGQGRIPAIEVMMATPAIRAMIREGRSHHVHAFIESGENAGMQTFDQALEELYRNNLVEFSAVIKKVSHAQKMVKRSATPAAGGAATPGAPLGLQPVSYRDAGDQALTISRKSIQHWSIFNLECRSYWSSSGYLDFEEGQLTYTHNYQSNARQAFITNFGILSGKSGSAFPLTKQVSIYYRAAPAKEQKGKESNYIQIHLYCLGGQKINLPEINESTLGIPLAEDEEWHTLIIDIPEEYQGNIVKIYMLEFLRPVDKIEIRQITFFN
ncbi:MAG: PilT/PilU family type 4a pilus ATPase [Candidatus Omnitrophica bacterium]|nr:PilT/PilU family type 4a pilus ATPase [Candidatus Omnitrophota bacterium]